ncbi:MAG: DUF502 domain-containing protein [Chlamydiae bacterium]|nr:DUF502 domain-containing protein [Chlamydiota bacterium]MBI3266410.1 DUF502 domain-containing protein [Chlamydiota bacterium]
MFLKEAQLGSHKIRVYFLTGLVVSLPVLGSFWILSLLFVKLTDFIFRYVSPEGVNSVWEKMMWRSAALAILFFGVVFIGLIARNYLGKKLIQWGELILGKIPVLNKIYSALKQIFESFWGKGNSFRSVVLVEFPRDGVYSVGFVTSEGRNAIQEKIGPDRVSVFIPTVPNPTSGFFIFIPKDKLIKLNISIEDAFKMIISSGMVTPVEKTMKN